MIPVFALLLLLSALRYAFSALKAQFIQPDAASRHGLIQALALRHVAFFAVELRNACLVCSSVHKPGHMATDSAQPRTAALRLCAEFTWTAPAFNRTTGVHAESLG